MEPEFDAIVLGLGAMGSAAAYQLAKRGAKVLGIDRFSPPHAYGSSQGDSRITRQAIGEGEQYTPLALRSYEIWREIEEETGENLLTITGGLVIATSVESAFFKNTLSAAKKFDIRHEVLDASQIRGRFPQFNVQDTDAGYYEYNAGYLHPEACISAQISLAKKYGAQIRTDERVESFTEGNGIVKVKTGLGEYSAKKLILTAGPWIPELIGKEYADIFSTVRQVLYWFKPKVPIEQFEPGHFPVFLWELGGDKQGLYGFPAIKGPEGGVKIANHQYGTPATAETLNRDVSAEEIREMYETFVAPYLPDLSDTCVQAVPCLYTNTADFDFLIDTHPHYPSVIIASPCSGHGFKHSAAIGEALAQLALEGKSLIDTSSFGIGRFLKK